jgi:hypothetical protein
MTYLFDFVQIRGIHSGRSKKLVEINQLKKGSKTVLERFFCRKVYFIV